MGFRRLAPVALALFTAVALAGGASASCDTAFSQQWNLQKIAAPGGWNASTGTGVTVGVVDSGADSGHPDFGGRVTTYDCTLSGDACGPAGSGTDQNGHGTHVTGIVAATKDNNEGIAGVAPEARVVVAKVFTCNNSACDDPGATFEDVVTGVNKVLSAGAKVVNLSLGDAGVLGFFCDNSSFSDLLNQIWTAGAVPVFAAGNCGGGVLGGNANFSNTNALIVGATGPDDAVPAYSSSLGNAKWGLVAPGGAQASCGSNSAGCILSTWPRSKISAGQAPYAWLHGTSMAAPHVAGAMAAVLARQPDKFAAVNALLGGLDKYPCDPARCGQGRLNLARALGVSATPAAGSCGATTTTPSPGGTTATTKKPSTTRTTPRATSGATTSTAIAATGDTTTTSEPVTDEPAVVDDDQIFGSSAGPVGEDSRPKDDGVNGPLAVLGVLGVLGVGGTAAPLVWRRFLRPG